MKTIYHIRWDDEELEGFFDENDKFIDGWCLNDAHWRGEYMNPFLKELGYIVNDDKDLTEKHKTAFRHCFGL